MTSSVSATATARDRLVTLPLLRLEVPSSGSELERRRIEGADARAAIAAAQRGVPTLEDSVQLSAL